MRRLVVITIVTLFLAACSPYISPAGATPATPPAAATADPCAPGDKPCWTEHIRQRANERIWWLEVRAQQERERVRRIYAFAAAVEAQRIARLQLGDCYLQGVVICNGRDLPTRYIVWRESRFQWWKKNPRSSAAGLYGILAGWMAKCRIYGYAHMGQVPIAEQARCARYIWNGGVNSRGLGPVHWGY